MLEKANEPILTKDELETSKQLCEITLLAIGEELKKYTDEESIFNLQGQELVQRAKLKIINSHLSQSEKLDQAVELLGEIFEDHFDEVVCGLRTRKSRWNY